jgi:hypothetical protein
LQSEKHDEPIISTFFGIHIWVTDENENADDSIRFNEQSVSKKISPSEKHPKNRMFQ